MNRLLDRIKEMSSDAAFTKINLDKLQAHLKISRSSIEKEIADLMQRDTFVMSDVAEDANLFSRSECIDSICVMMDAINYINYNSEDSVIYLAIARYFNYIHQTKDAN